MAPGNGRGQGAVGSPHLGWKGSPSQGSCICPLRTEARVRSTREAHCEPCSRGQQASWKRQHFKGKSADGGSMWRIAAPSTCSQLLVSRLRVPGGPWGQGASSDIDPLPSWGGRAHCGGCFQRAATEFQGRATFALLALFPPFLLALGRVKASEIWDRGLDFFLLCAPLASKPQPILLFPARLSLSTLHPAFSLCSPSPSPPCTLSSSLLFPLGFSSQEDTPVVPDEHRTPSGCSVRGRGEGP